MGPWTELDSPESPAGTAAAYFREAGPMYRNERLLLLLSGEKVSGKSLLRCYES